MSASAEQQPTHDALMWCREVTLPPTRTPPLLVTHEYGSNWIHWRQTSVNWEDNDDRSQLFRGRPSKGLGGGGEASCPPRACSSQQEGVCGGAAGRSGRGLYSPLCSFSLGGSNKAIKKALVVESSVLWLPLRSSVKEGALWRIITANNNWACVCVCVCVCVCRTVSFTSAALRTPTSSHPLSKKKKTSILKFFRHFVTQMQSRYGTNISIINRARVSSDVKAWLWTSAVIISSIGVGLWDLRSSLSILPLCRYCCLSLFNKRGGKYLYSQFALWYLIAFVINSWWDNMIRNA